ncbi:hypothetical protein Tco_0191400 [Tanacetum coccineum]
MAETVAAPVSVETMMEAMTPVGGDLMKKVVVGKDGKPLMAARCVHFDANRPGVNEHGDLIGKDGNTRKVVHQVNFENNAIVAVDTPANDVSTSAMKNINMTQNVLENEKPVTFVTSLSAAPNTNKEDTHGAANHATMEPGVFGNSLNGDANNNNNMRDKSTCVQNYSHGTKEGTHAVGTGSKQSFASIFKTQSVSKAMRLTTMTSEFVQGANVAIPLAVVKEVSQRFENTLYGYFIGKRLAFPLGMERVLENGSWLIRLVPIFLNIWTPNTVLKKDTITSAPIWVKLHHVPIVAFPKIGLSLITSQLGRPIMLDAYTSTMCQKSWGRNSYARALVEVSLLVALKESLVVAIPFPNRTGHSLETVEVEDAECPKNVKVMDSTPVEDEDGFTQVKRKNGKGKQDGKAKHVAGIHLTKPKPKLIYHEAQKPPTNNNDKATTSNSDSSVRKDNQPTMQPEEAAKDSLEDVLGDDDEDVEEVYIEYNGRHAKQNKGASTPSNQRLCSKVFKQWQWTSNRLMCSKGSRIILGWKLNIVNVAVVSFDAQVMHVCVYFKADKKELFCSFAYTHNRDLQRRDLWNNLATHKNYIQNGPWCILGDFNVSLSADEKSTGPFYIDTSMRDFQNCVEAIEVSYVNSTCLRFTWNQKPKVKHGTLKKIDRIMANLDFYSSFVGSSVVFQPYRISDHSPAVLRIPMEYTSNPLSGFWMFKVVKRLKMLKKPLHKLLYDLGNLHENVKKFLNELDMVQTALDSDPSNLELWEEEAVYL